MQFISLVKLFKDYMLQYVLLFYVFYAIYFYYIFVFTVYMIFEYESIL